MRTTQRAKAVLLSTVGMSLALCAGEAVAASADDTHASTLDELIVTATRKDTAIFDVPAPVTAVSGDTLKAFGTQDLKSVVNLVPNAVLPKSPDNYTLFVNIRGIQQTDVQAQPNFGTYRNGMYAGGERPSVGPLIDVERVEILSGPQAGLYGRSAVGGAINVIYATPTDKFGGYISADYGRYDRVDLQGAINVPLSSTFDARLTAWYQNQNTGQLYNAQLNTYVDKSRHDGLRLSGRWRPTDKLTVTWMGEYSDNRGPSTQAYAPNGITNLLIKSPAETPNVIRRDTPDINWNHQTYLSQDLTYESTVGRFQWLASYSQYRMHDIEDSDKTGLDPTSGITASTVLQRKEGTRNFYTEGLWFSPEGKRLTVTAGASYFDQNFEFGRTIATTLDLDYFGGPVAPIACQRYLSDSSCPGVPGGTFPAIGLQTGLFAAPGNTTIGTRSFSVFGQATFHITPQLSLIGALRYTNDREALNFHQFALPGGSVYVDALFANTFPTIDLVKTFSYSKVSPSLELNYKPTNDINIYALWSTGFRPGGFNTFTTSAQYIPYGSETADNYEAGVKTRWLGGRLALNADVFLMYQHNLLTYQPDPIAPPEFFFYYLNNVGEARTYGVELAAQAKLTSWWTASATVGWEKGELTAGTSYGYPLAGGQLQLTRTWTVNIQSQVRYPIGGGYDLIGGLNWRYESGGYLDITTIAWPELSRLDANIGVARGGASVVAYVNNAFNSRPPQFVYGNGATTLVDGATYGLRFLVKY